MRDELCLIRGGGDLATGVAWRLSRAGFPVVVTELPEPLTVRRTVALSSAVDERRVDIEGMIGRLADGPQDAARIAARGEVAVLVEPGLADLKASVVVDARLAKRNIDTTIADAPLVITLGPGFDAMSDCDVVVETMRGPRLGRAIWSGSATPNTGTPGYVGGRGAERVLRAPANGTAHWQLSIGDLVTAGQVIGAVALQPVAAPFDGLIRGLIRDGRTVRTGTKIGDVDPRPDTDYMLISDKALAVGGGALEAVMTWQHRLR